MVIKSLLLCVLIGLAEVLCPLTLRASEIGTPDCRISFAKIIKTPQQVVGLMQIVRHGQYAGTNAIEALSKLTARSYRVLVSDVSTFTRGVLRPQSADRLVIEYNFDRIKLLMYSGKRVVRKLTVSARNAKRVKTTLIGRQISTGYELTLTESRSSLWPRVVSIHFSFNFEGDLEQIDIFVSGRNVSAIRWRTHLLIVPERG